MSHDADNIATATEAVAGWQTFAAEGRARLLEEVALSAKYDQLHPLHALPNGRQPAPIRFYGPGPDGRVRPNDPPVGTLHYARWRRELAAFEDPDGDGYYHEEHPLTINGHQIRPTYTTRGNQTAREVNYFRWEKVTADSMKGIKTFPGSGTTRAIHDEYLLNEDDFNNNLDFEKPKVSLGLDNREGEDLETIYPLGYKLLKRWSQTDGHTEWKEGVCLGADPHNPSALTKPLGWLCKRPRIDKAGLGADPQDAVWNEVFHGNLDARRKEKFSRPKDTWSSDPAKVTIMASSKSSNNMTRDPKDAPTFYILSLTALMATLPSPEPDTLRAREAWIEMQAAKRSGDRVQQDFMAKRHADDKLKLMSLIDRATTANSTKLIATKVTQEVNIELTTKLEVLELAEHNKNAEAEEHLEMADTVTEGEVSEHSTSEEHNAITARLKELSRNPEPGKEGKTPILMYSSFRSRFLGTPVTQIMGYEG
ncbi:hypothetical protein F5Y01DRAFT_320379 [Xylaria sp. FL0043]|nr:hypothetical protein F5Y01DRAFT_320379 [Xylaria sp. FL0043]